MQNERAKNTIRAYRDRWAMFSAWCQSAGRRALPASPETVKLYVAWSVDVRHYRLETIKLTLSAINAEHRAAAQPTPVDEDVRALVTSCARHLREQPRGKSPITPEQLSRICRGMTTRPVDARDRALLLAGFACASRRSELAILDYPADVHFTSAGVVLWQRYSKVDQEGKGRQIGLPYARKALTCPVRALEAWIAARGEWAGPLFVRFAPPDGRLMLRERISGCGICAIAKRWIKRAGVDPGAYGAHSLRAGMATAASVAGASDSAIMQRGAWKSHSTVLRYIRPAQAFASDPLANVL